MRIDIIAALPHYFDSVFDNAIYKRSIQSGLLQLHVHDLRQFGIGNYKQIDDYPFGGTAGMVLMPEPLANCIDQLLSNVTYDDIIYLTPDGELFNQKMANQLSLSKNLLLICGHYKGIDQRIRDMYVTKEISIGDYVLSGGEIAASVLTDAVLRLVPGIMSDETSALTDSHQDGLLAPPVYTRPSDFKGHKVPDILLSGHEKKINEWLHDQSIFRTKARRPDLFETWDGE
ncbi:MAG: tRNA (guanosine(37)-N1)-methyltransferase TrmD [Saprospiraceae bacterium]|nr:tRNA (guanosine(37)-N1)-methyltransferase TrmD [Saprospiraceae bacterium]